MGSKGRMVTLRISFFILVFVLMYTACVHVKDPLQDDGNASVTIIIKGGDDDSHWLGDSLDVDLEFVLPRYIDSAIVGFGDTVVNFSSEFMKTYKSGEIEKIRLYLDTYGDSQEVTAVIMVGKKEYTATEYVHVGAHVPAFTKELPDTLFRQLGAPCSLAVKVIGERVTYYWYKDSVLYDSTAGAQLILPGDSVAESGRYSCVAANIAGKDTSDTCEVNMCSKPLITQDLIDTAVLNGEPLELSIVAIGGFLTYKWYRDGTEIKLKTASTYVVPAMKKEHNGVYKCIVSNMFGSDTSLEAEVVAALAPDFNGHLVDTALTQGDSLVLAVEATGGALAYQWYKDTAAIDSATEAELHFDSLTTNDNGNYFCRITNIAGSKNSDTIELVVMSVPVITKDIESAGVTAGKEVAFTIEATGGNLTYQWQKDKENIDLKRSQSFGIPKMSAEHMGFYRCIVTNPLGSDTSFEAALVLASKPDIASFTKNAANYSLGDPCSLSVVANGYTLSYAWYKDDILLTGNDSAYFVVDSFTAKNDGIYRCVVSNVAGTVSTDELVVALVGAPSITTDLESAYNVAPDSSVTLSVKVDEKDVVYTWYRSEDGKMKEVSRDALFVIEVMKPENVGIYQCVVSNAAGTDTSIKSSISILKKPVITSRTESPVQVAEGGVIDLYVVASGDQLSYSWKSEKGETVGRSDSLEIKNAADEHGGEYYCIVSNKAGADTSDPIRVVVRIPDVKRPTLVALTPADGEGKVAVALEKVVAVFSEPILGSSIDAGTMYIVGRSGDTKLGHGEDSSTVVLTLDSELALGTEYTVVIRRTLTDTAGNTLGDSIVSKFRTATDLVPNIIVDTIANVKGMVPLTGMNNGKTSLAISYEWSQIDGPPVTLNPDNAANTWFQAPVVPSAVVLRLRLSTVDGPSDYDTVVIRVYKDKDRMLFVSPQGKDVNDGLTIASPLLTITKALKLAELDRKDIYVANGTYSESIVLQKGVSIYGGYHPETWMVDDDNTTVINGTTSRGVTAVDVKDVTLSKLTINAREGSVPSESSVGMKMYRCTTMTIIDCKISAANGRTGSDGNPGATGSGYPYGGGGGGSAGPFFANGGNGGAGAGYEGKAGGAGGAGGWGSGSGGNGGFNGDSGAAVGAGAVFKVLHQAGEYVVQNGFAGDNGRDGTGGGGGGGCTFSAGGAGGGGGAGGRGGAGGNGGGASIGCVVVESKKITIENCSFVSKNAGSGGSGGIGGAGLGGAGGAAGAGLAGAGGAGGAGGKGRSGGGGAGGPSLALLTDSLTVATFNSNYATVNTMEAGSEGTKGSCVALGSNPAAECKAGEDGIAEEVYILP